MSVIIRTLIALLWVIGCVCFICFLIGCLNMLISKSHDDFPASLARTFLMSFLFMFIVIPHSELTMDIFKYIYNFFRMCFGDDMNGIGRLQFFIMGMKTKTGSLFNPLIWIVFLYCSVKHFITARKEARQKVLALFPVIFAIESVIIMCTIDRIISLILLVAGLAAVFSTNINASNNKGFAKKYVHNNYNNNTIDRYTLISEGEFGNKNIARIQDYDGNIISVYKDGNGVVSDSNGNIFEPE